MGLFHCKSILDEQTIAWLFDTWAWLLGSFGGFEPFAETPLVEPSDEDFPIAEVPEDELAEQVFALVREHAELQDWPCVLSPQPRRSQTFAQPGLVEVTEEGLPAGTFSLGGDDRQVARISYDPSLVERPEDLVATLAHELAHYLLATAPTLPPGAEGALERATDVATVFMGFGIFGANAAFHFEQFQGGDEFGWSWQRSGYLTEEEWAYALAIFLRLQDLPALMAREWLDPSPAGYLHAAFNDLKRRGAELARLRAVNDNAGERTSARLEWLAERLERRGDVVPGARLGLRAMARAITDEPLHGLRATLDDLVRRRAPRDRFDALAHHAGLAATAALLDADPQRCATWALHDFERLAERPGLPRLSNDVLEMGLAMAWLAGKEERATDLLAARTRADPEPGDERMSMEALTLATAPYEDGAPSRAGEPGLADVLVGAALRGWLEDVLSSGGETAALFPCLLASRLGETGPPLVDRLRYRVSAFEDYQFSQTGNLLVERLTWYPLEATFDEDTGAHRLQVAVVGRGPVNGALDPAPPLTSHLLHALGDLDLARGATPSATPAASTQPVRPRLAPELDESVLHADLRLAPGVEVAEPDRRLLAVRFAVAVRHGLPGDSLCPGKVRLGEPIPESPGSESPGSESPGSESPGSESPGSESPGLAP